MFQQHPQIAAQDERLFEPCVEGLEQTRAVEGRIEDLRERDRDLLEAVAQQSVRVFDPRINDGRVTQGRQSDEFMGKDLAQFHADGIAHTIKFRARRYAQLIRRQRPPFDQIDQRARLFMHERKERQRLFERRVAAQGLADEVQLVEHECEAREDGVHVCAERIGRESLGQREQLRLLIE